MPGRTADPPRASVIVAVYNGAATLSGCIDSLLDLDYPATHVQLLCVDNGSTDASPRILSGYGTRLTVLHEPKRGPAAARNRGLRAATGDVVALTDADCVVDPHWLRHIVTPLGDPAVGIVGGTILSRRPCNSIEAFGEAIHDHHRAINEFLPPYVITMNWCTRRAVLAEIGPFNEDLLRCSDVDFSYRVVAAGHRLVYEPRAVIYHQNERTPWGLMHEGYVHGYHAVEVRRLHTALLDVVRRGPRRRVAPPAEVSLPVQRLPAHPWRTPVWAYLFNLGKRIGHRRGSARAARSM